MTQGHPSGKPENTTQLPTHLSHEKETCHLYHLVGHKGTKTSQGTAPQQPTRVYMDALAQTSLHGHHRTTHPNELTQVPSNDLPVRVYMGAHKTETKGQGRGGQTSCTNVYKSTLGSQLSIFVMGSFTLARPRLTRPNELTRTPLNDPPERIDSDALKRPTRTSSHGCPNNRNEGTRESRANELHGRAQSQFQVTN
jgi:hypothetical protein